MVLSLGGIRPSAAGQSSIREEVVDCGMVVCGIDYLNYSHQPGGTSWSSNPIGSNTFVRVTAVLPTVTTS